MYKSLKEGWFPLSFLCKKYKKDRSNSNRDLKNVDIKDKEQLGRTWVVKEDAIKKVWKIN